MSVQYICGSPDRRHAVKTITDDNGKPLVNGIDYLEVSPDQKTLTVYFLHKFSDLPNAAVLSQDNVVIEGGERIKDIKVDEPVILEDNIMTCEVDRTGDFSLYTLRLVTSSKDMTPPEGYDPLLSLVSFSFKVNCTSEFDCRQERRCPPRSEKGPEINYLAKDYASFRQLMLDRMSVLMPEWKERNAADLGITLVELLAYAGDYLSYRQDAVATEAYLNTARKRVSVRRHARLVDYFMHDGCNARVWVQICAKEDGVKVPKGSPLTTRTSLSSTCILPDSPEYAEAMSQHPEIFETMHEITLLRAHNEMFFYTWGDRKCCLPKGATRATLRDDLQHLKAGDVLIFVEEKGPRSGAPADADRTRRHAVRLTHVMPSQDLLGGRFKEEPDDKPVAVTEIEWAVEDSLPFPFCISGATEEAHGAVYETDISVALGNIVLADHGATISSESLGAVPDPMSSRFRPRLKEGPLTHALPLLINANDALPVIELESKKGDGIINTWTPRKDLLNSHSEDTQFVVEVEADGTAFLRFGDGVHGMRPEAGTEFTATYRVGNGVAGNVGAETMRHIITRVSGIETVWNPLPASGGTEPESIEQVRQAAPYAFRTQERAVTPEDYAEVAQRHQEVQKAVATFRWTGSWRTVFLTIDRMGGLIVDEDFKRKMRAYLEKYRMAGYDLDIEGPRYVPLEIEMSVCVRSDYFRSDVRQALLEVLSNQDLPDGRKGVFHPDNFTFGQTVYLSPVYAAIEAVDGVDSVLITKFQRQGIDSGNALEDMKMPLGRLEIARLDNDPNYPERGVLKLNIEGGK